MACMPAARQQQQVRRSLHKRKSLPRERKSRRTLRGPKRSFSHPMAHRHQGKENLSRRLRGHTELHGHRMAMGIRLSTDRSGSGSQAA